MQIPHIIIVEEVLPEVRKRTAEKLTRKGWSQERIGEVLGVSQAMVSRYLKDGRTCPRSLEMIIERISGEMEVAALASMSKDEIADRFCISLERSMQRGELVDRYVERFGSTQIVSIYGIQGPAISRAHILKDLEIAASFLEKDHVGDLIPAVKINMAYALDDAKDEMDVAAFPGRLPDKGGRLLRPLPPEFGASRHLAGTLLEARKMSPRIISAINLKLNPELEDIIGGLVESGELLEIGKISEQYRQSVILFRKDPGDFGIEPCLYLFAGSPLELAGFTVKLQDLLNNKVKGNDG